MDENRVRPFIWLWFFQKEIIRYFPNRKKNILKDYTRRLTFLKKEQKKDSKRTLTYHIISYYIIYLQ